MCSEFLAGSELHRALDISLPEYTDYMADAICSLLAQENSFVAIDDSDHSIVGCILAGDFSPGSDVDAQKKSTDIDVPEFAQPIQALLVRLENQYKSLRADNLQSTLLVDIAVVVPQARGQGVYTRLRQAVHQRALDRGYTTVVGELSSAATQHLCVEKLGHKVICEIPYSSFEYEGLYPFSTITNPTSIQLVEGVLTDRMR